MSDAPSNLPFEPMDEPLQPPVPPAPPAPPVVPPLAPPMPRPVPPPPAPPVASSPSVPVSNAKPVEDVFAGIETAPSSAAPAARPMANAAPMPSPASSHRTGIALAIVGFLVLVTAAAGSWWYFFGKETATSTLTPAKTATSTRDLPILPPPAQEPSTFTPDQGNGSMQIVPLPEPVTTPPPGTNIPAPTPVAPGSDPAPFIPTSPDGGSSSTSSAPSAPTSTPSEPTPTVQFDTDGDGLTDARENELGTNPLKPDTDGDTLSDRQEVEEYSTNPLNPDTDNDGFPDGVEIGNGYNPRGTGKCSRTDCRT